MTRDEVIQSLKRLPVQAIDWLNGISTQSCDCDLHGESRIDNPCGVCQARRAQQLIDDVLLPKHEVLWPERMKNLAERIFVDAWRKRSPGLNGGYGTLELILQQEAEAMKSKGGFGCLSMGYVPHVSQRDATVAASIIQWLGTNCGGSFLANCEAEIKKQRAERESYGVSYPYCCSFDPIAESEELRRVAASIAEDFISKDKYPSVVNCLTSAITNLVTKWHKRQIGKMLATTKTESEVPA